MWRLTTLGWPVSITLQATAESVTVPDTMFSVRTPP